MFAVCSNCIWDLNKQKLYIGALLPDTPICFIPVHHIVHFPTPHHLFTLHSKLDTFYWKLILMVTSGRVGGQMTMKLWKPITVVVISLIIVLMGLFSLSLLLQEMWKPTWHSNYLSEVKNVTLNSGYGERSCCSCFRQHRRPTVKDSLCYSLLPLSLCLFFSPIFLFLVSSESKVVLGANLESGWLIEMKLFICESFTVSLLSFTHSHLSREREISQSQVWALVHWTDWDRVVCTERESRRDRRSTWKLRMRIEWKDIRWRERISERMMEKMNFSCQLQSC